VTAFVGRAAAEPPEPPAEGAAAITGPAVALEPLFHVDREDDLAGETGAAEPGEVPAAVRAFFAAGGRCCLVAARGGPGSGEGAIDWRGAANLLADADEVGTIVLLGASAQGARERALQLADRRPDLFFILEGRGGERAGSIEPPRPFAGSGAACEGPAILYLRENVALVRPSPESPRGPAFAALLGDLAGFLEAGDFTPEPPFTPVPPAPPWLAEPDRRYLAWWRRREGLRRSIDLGTRWVLLEPDDSLLRRRVERDVAAFLRRLERHGLLDGDGDGPRFEVECAPLAGGAPSRIAIEVHARVRAPPLAARGEPAVRS
jgi:hypothetical protein